MTLQIPLLRCQQPYDYSFIKNNENVACHSTKKLFKRKESPSSGAVAI